MDAAKQQRKCVMKCARKYLIINEYCQVLKDFIHFQDLLVDVFDALLPVLDHRIVVVHLALCAHPPSC